MFDDIRPPRDGKDKEPTSVEDHSIRNVAPLATEERETRRARRSERRRIGDSEITKDNSNPLIKRKIAVGKIGIWAVAGVILIVALSAVAFIFIGKTTLIIEPQQESISLSTNVVYTAYQDTQEGELGYTVLSHSIEATDVITATGRETVEEKASGRIIVYNEHSSASQRLIKNTRFEAPNGEIYRVRNSIIVPGKKSDGTPGSIEITVYADKAGENQNITVLGTRFTIPGLKGDLRYDTFYAELKEVLVGGFVGERAIVDPDVLNAAQTALRAQLAIQVEEALRTQAPDTAEIFKDAIFVTFESKSVEYADSETALVREVVHIQAAVFDKNQLARMFASVVVAIPIAGEVRIDSPENIVMTIINKEGVDIANDSLIQFTFEGSSVLTWVIDTEALKQDLIGRHSGALNAVMSGYPGIKGADAEIRPFWKNEFPSETSGISIELLLTK